MRISNIKLLSDAGRLKLSADITIGENAHSLYFVVDEKYKDFIVSDATPFLASIFIGAMNRGEDVDITSPINKTVYDNTSKIAGLYKSWNLGYKTSLIRASDFRHDQHKGKAIGCFFSGGVDSFYSYLKNTKESSEKITHFILVHGFDIDLANKTLWNTTVSHIRAIAKEAGIKVILVETNLRSITDPLVDWSWTFGSALGATALLLRNGFKKIYISASVAESELYPWGSHPLLDPLWSSEHMRIIHDGIEATRFEKIKKYVGPSPLAQKYLRVCFLNKNNSYNCGSCAKCIRTMIDLSITGNLPRSKTFPPHLEMKRVRSLDTRNSSGRLFLEKSLQELRLQHTDIELQEALEYALTQSLRPSFKIRAKDYIGYLDKTYNKNRLYKLLTRKGLLH